MLKNENEKLKKQLAKKKSKSKVDTQKANKSIAALKKKLPSKKEKDLAKKKIQETIAEKLLQSRVNEVEVSRKLAEAEIELDTSQTTKERLTKRLKQAETDLAAAMSGEPVSWCQSLGTSDHETAKECIYCSK
mmetsp:Transcript_15780/g.18632  ORF Transcript_15780/g.18632 Transcript_15780/m.18632 type:complete len:133 (+) Transcript_15780:203-601(+)